MKITIPSTTNKRGKYVDRFGIEWDLNSSGFRTIEFDAIDFTRPRALAMGCSHTMGDGNKFEDSWPEVLKKKINFSQIINLGQFRASSDYIVRILPDCLTYFEPEVIFVFWPDYVRFEICNNGVYTQIVPSDKDRILYMESHPEEALKEQYNTNIKKAHELCNKSNVRLIGISWDELIPIIDHADRWDYGADNSHYGKNWHAGVAETFKRLYDSK